MLIALGVLFLGTSLLPSFGAWIPTAMFAAAGIAFLAWYLARPEQAWPILPGGILLTIAAVTAWSQMTTLDGGTVFFTGLALTFLGFAVAPPPSAHRRWGYWVGGACAVIAVLATGLSWAWPLALIVLGAWLLVRRGAGTHA